MAKFAPANANYINRIDPSGYLLSLLQKHEDAISNIAAQTNANPGGPSAQAPSKISSVAATVLSPGNLKVEVQDNNPATRGLWYHYEVSTSPDFEVGTVIHAIATPSRTAILPVGGGAVYARAYSQYLTSPPSTPVAAPAAVDPGGTARTGSISGSGSGTESSLQAQPGAGFGFTPIRIPRL